MRKAQVGNRSGTLTQRARDLGIPVIELIRRAEAEHGSELMAAIALGVFPNALRWHKTRAKQAAAAEAQR